MTAKAIISKPTSICVSVTAIEISEAAFRRLTKKKPTVSDKETEIRPVAQVLTLVVDGKCVYKTPAPLSFERSNLFTVIERMSGCQLNTLLEHHNFMIYNKTVNCKGRSYAKVKPVSDPAVKLQEISDHDRAEKEATYRISQSARQRQIVFAAARR
jgi:hypothetical protein